MESKVLGKIKMRVIKWNKLVLHWHTVNKLNSFNLTYLLSSPQLFCLCFLFVFILSIWCFACMYLCAPHVCLLPAEAKMALDHLELGVQVAVSSSMLLLEIKPESSIRPLDKLSSLAFFFETGSHSW